MTRIRVRSFLQFLCFTIVVSCCCSAVSQEIPSTRKSYFPLAVGNRWEYSVSGNSPIRQKTLTWRVTQREVVHGVPVFYLWQTPALGDEPLSLEQTPQGIAEAGTDRFLIKNETRAGERWMATSQSLRANSKRDSFEIVSVRARCTVANHSFRDCVVVRETDEANNVSSETTYARGVGPVKYVYFKGLDYKKLDTTLTIRTWRVH